MVSESERAVSDKVPQSTKVLVARLQRVAKALDREAEFPEKAAGLTVSIIDRERHAKNAAAWRARANTCWQAAARLEELKGGYSVVADVNDEYADGD